MTADPRDRILEAAAHLLTTEGPSGVSTRAVATAAGVQAPTLYRLFGDKQGLIDAVVTLGFERYLAGKHAIGSTGDVIEDMRRGWDLHVEFGMTHPAFYGLMFGNPKPGQPTPGAEEAHRLLLAILRRAASAGILAVPVQTAAQMMHSAAVGVTLQLIANPAQAAEGLSHQVRDAIFAAVLTTPPLTDSDRRPLAVRAIALDAALDDASDSPALTPPEVALLRQWLTRLASPA